MTDREAKDALLAILETWEPRTMYEVISDPPRATQVIVIDTDGLADHLRAAGVTLTPSLDEGLREERFGDAVMAALRLRLIHGATDATYTPREVAEMVSHVIEKQVRRLAQEGETPNG